MTDLLCDLLVRLLVAAILTVLIIGGVALFGHHIAYWAAALIGVGLVFGSLMILDGDWID